MSKVRQAFARGKAFIPFVTCGDPSLAVTEALVCAMAEAGADLIELGFPTRPRRGRSFRRRTNVRSRAA